MQNKGLVTVFAVLFGLVSIYQLSFTFIANKVEDNAKEFANSKYDGSEPKLRDVAEAAYLDSVAGEPVFMGIDYLTAKEKELNKGLDLKGGINVILQISVQDILRGLANNTKDPAFNQALSNAVELQKDSQDSFLESFFKAFDALPGENSLASPSIFFNKNLEDDIDASMTNDDVKPVIARKIDESVTSAFEVLRKRIDKFGVTQPNIQRIGQTGRILVELPGARDVERVKKLLQSTAQLEFWDLYKNEELQGFMIAADAKIKELKKGTATTKDEKTQALDSTKTDSTSVASTGDDEIDALLGGEDVETANEEPNTANPFLSKMVSPGFQGGPVLGNFALKDTSEVNGYLRIPQVRSLLPAELRYAKFVWGLPTFNEQLGEEVTSLYALRANRNNEAPLAGGVVTDAQQSYNQTGQVVVDMQMNGRGAKIWEEMTGKAYESQTNIAVVLDDLVYSAPGVSSGAIPGGRTQISGAFTITEGQD